MDEGGELKPFSNIPVIVVTNNDDFSVSFEQHHKVNSPKEALDLLRGKDFEIALVAGGGKLNGSFLQENLIDEIYVDIEPKVIGKGIPIFADTNGEATLELIEVNKLSDNEIQLHYRIIKN